MTIDQRAWRVHDLPRNPGAARRQATPSPAQARPSARSARSGHGFFILPQANSKARLTMSFSRWLRNWKIGSAVRVPGRARRARPQVEALEDRLVPTIYFVTTTADDGNDVNPITGSLRQAILAANAAPGSDEIKF